MPGFLYPSLLKHQYNIAFGKRCNLKNPCTFTEKTQWAKLYRDNKRLSEYADKISVREYVGSTVGSEYLIPIIGSVYKSADEIEFDKLPNQFVIKTNHGCGFNYIVKDKTKEDYDYIKKTVNQWLKYDSSVISLEQQYKYIEPRIYIEKYMISEGINDLPDYKFFCFDGKVFCSYTMMDYTFNHKEGKLGFFDRAYNLMPYHRADYKPITTQLPKPENYEKMVEIAERLSKGFSHVRIDLYNIKGNIFFGEMTFTTNGGFCHFVPEEFDRILGNQWDLKAGI
nr:ATP-grasp fold amidoligase family protein [Butyrivibrio sp. WCD3002]